MNGYLERCARTLYEEICHDRPEMDLYEAVRAVLEAGRLSECPAAYDAVADLLTTEQIDELSDAETERDYEAAKRLLRAAEDAAMGAK
jgi:hypothetical protein